MFVKRSYEEEKTVSEGSEEDDDYVPYVPVKIRKQQMVSCPPLNQCLCQCWEAHSHYVPTFSGPCIAIKIFFFLLSFHNMLKMFSHSCKKCYIYEERQWRRIGRTAAGTRGMRMKVSVHAPMSVFSTSISTSRKKLRVCGFFICSIAAFVIGIILQGKHDLEVSDLSVCLKLGRSLPRRNN